MIPSLPHPADQMFASEFASRVGAAGFDTRLSRREDGDFLCALFAATQPARDVLPDSLIRLQYESRSATYAAQTPHATSLLITRYGTPIGCFIVDWTQADYTWGVDLAVLPEERRGAVGWRVLGAWLAVADRLGKAAGLCVAPANPARLIYRRLGFVERDAGAVPLVMERLARKTPDI